MAFCSNCGTKAPEGVKFCPECGTRFATVAAPAPAVEEPIPAPMVEEPAPVVVEEPAPVVVEEPVPVVEEPASAVQQPAAPVKFEVGEDGLEYVPYVPVENPQPLGAPAVAAAPKAEATVQETPAPKKVEKEPKKGIAKFLPLIIGGGVALVAIFVALIVLVVSLIGGLSGADDIEVNPVLGVYDAVYAEMMGYEIAVQDIWSNGVSIELQDKGKCVVELDGKESKGKWTLEDDGVFNVKGGQLDCTGILADGEMTLENVMGMGVELTLLKEGYSDPSVEDPGVPEDDGSLTEVQEKWNGVWYGVINFMECTGKYSEYDYMQYDAYMTVELDENGKGMMKMWIDPNLPAFAEATVEEYEGMLFTGEGKLLGGEMDCNNWMFMAAPDSEERYVMPYDRIDDEDGDMYEYVVFMKKWGVSWRDEIDRGEIVPPYVDAYEEYIAAGMEAPVLPADAPLASALSEAVADGPYIAVTNYELVVPSNWYGWVQFTNWWGNDEADSLVDAWGTLAYDGDLPYFEVYVDNVDAAFYSVYLELTDDNTTIRPIADGEAWVGDYYMAPGDEDKYSLHSMADGTLCAEFEFVGASGEYGCDVVMCFREHGQLWDEYEDQLPPGYDEYLNQLAEEAALEEARANEDPADLPEGDGYMTYNQLEESFAWLYEYGSNATMEEVVEEFGVPGALQHEEEDFCSYRWQTADDSARVVVSFVPKNGQWVYNGMSWTGDLGE